MARYDSPMLFTYRFQLGATYPERVYCVQYDESDLHFIGACAKKRAFTSTSSTAP